MLRIKKPVEVCSAHWKLQTRVIFLHHCFPKLVEIISLKKPKLVGYENIETSASVSLPYTFVFHQVYITELEQATTIFTNSVEGLKQTS